MYIDAKLHGVEPWNGTSGAIVSAYVARTFSAYGLGHLVTPDHCGVPSTAMTDPVSSTVSRAGDPAAFRIPKVIMLFYSAKILTKARTGVSWHIFLEWLCKHHTVQELRGIAALHEDADTFMDTMFQLYREATPGRNLTPG